MGEIRPPVVLLQSVVRERVAEWFAAGKVKPVISERQPLCDAVAAMKRLTNRQVKGEIIILPEA